MKKTLSMIVAAALSLMSLSAFAQNDTQMFNHVSVGVGLGYDGLDLQIAAPIGPRFQVRAGFTFLDPILPLVNLFTKSAAGLEITPVNYTVDNINYHENGMNIDKVQLGGSIQDRDIHLMFDFFPSKSSSFRLTAGAFFSLTPGGILNLTGTPLSNSSAPAIPDSDKANTEFYGITTDPAGNILLDLKYGSNVVKPYVGIGFGRPVSLKRRVGVTFDLGVAYSGGTKIVSYNYSSGSAKEVVLDKAYLDKYPEVAEKLGKNASQIIAGANTFPILPIMNLSLFVRLF